MVWRTLWITVSTCFLLGTTFTHWIVDHNVMWTSPTTAGALERSITYYSLIASAPDGMGWAYILVGLSAIVSAAGRLSKVLKGGQSEMLFDGGSVVLLAGVAYVQLSQVFPAVMAVPARLPRDIQAHGVFPVLAESVRELASDNIMCAVMLTGVMLLQAGRYHSKRSSSRSSHSRASAKGIKMPDAETSDDQNESPLIRRSATPFRELTEEEALELRAQT